MDIFDDLVANWNTEIKCNFVKESLTEKSQPRVYRTCTFKQMRINWGDHVLIAYSKNEDDLQKAYVVQIICFYKDLNRPDRSNRAFVSWYSRPFNLSEEFNKTNLVTNLPFSTFLLFSVIKNFDLYQPSYTTVQVVFVIGFF